MAGEPGAETPSELMDDKRVCTSHWEAEPMAYGPGAETPSELMRNQGGRTEAGEPGDETPWSGE